MRMMKHKNIKNTNMKNINKHTKVVFALMFMFLFGCENFDEINTNPDTTTTVSASMLCTGVILNFTKFSGLDGKVMISANALPKYVGYANEGQMDAQYNKIGSSYFGGMTVLPNIEKMVEYADGLEAENSYKGVGKMARAYKFYHLTMEMGDIPYSEAGGGDDAIYKPAYDTQEQVLLGVLNELDEADQLFADGATFSGDPTPYNGDPEKWRRANNAFELRVLMSLSAKAGVASLDIPARFSRIVSEGYLMEESTGYFGLEYSTQDKHPLSGTNDLFTSKTIISSLLMDNLKNLNDRRLFYFAEPAATLITTYPETDYEAYAGVDVSMVYADMNAGHTAGEYSLLNKRYLEEEATEPRILISYAEQQLILAEAVIKGWISGSAGDYYEQGVKSALSAYLGYNAGYAHGMAITQDYIDNYFTGEAAFKTTSDEQLKQIWMQRYILNFMQDARTTFFEYRRNIYPDFPINPATSLNENNKDGIPMRWLYPESETKYNRENLETALNRQYDGYDEINKLMWVLK